MKGAFILGAIVLFGCGRGQTEDRAGGADAGISDGSDASCSVLAQASALSNRISIEAGSLAASDFPTALAIAECAYLDRCSPMAPYLFNECVGSILSGGAWSVTSCGAGPSGQTCAQVSVTVPPSPATWQQVLSELDAGSVLYDVDGGPGCLAAWTAQSCNGYLALYEGVGECTGVFRCADESDAGSCLLPLTPAPVACDASADCAGSDTPDCFEGFCGVTPCGTLLSVADGGATCMHFVSEGEACDSEISLLSATPVTSASGGLPENTCAPGLLCVGLSTSSLGLCSARQESCNPNLPGVTGCPAGFVCDSACRLCASPPSQGPCLAGPLPCALGVSYCDSSGTCQPVGQAGSVCTTSAMCAPDLECTSGACSPLTP